MADETITPEELERLEKAANDADGWDYEWPRIEIVRLPPYYPQRVFIAEANPTTILALIAAYRTQESEKRIAMRALEIGYEQERYTTEEKESWLAASRTQEGTNAIQD